MFWNRQKGTWNRRQAKSLEQKKSLRLGLESLEDRSLMAALAGGLAPEKLLLAPAANVNAASFVPQPTPAITASATVLTDDAYEQNDSLAAARNLGTLSGPTTI